MKFALIALVALAAGLVAQPIIQKIQVNVAAAHQTVPQRLNKFLDTLPNFGSGPRRWILWYDRKEYTEVTVINATDEVAMKAYLVGKYAADLANYRTTHTMANIDVLNPERVKEATVQP